MHIIEAAQVNRCVKSDMLTSVCIFRFKATSSASGHLQAVVQKALFPQGFIITRNLTV